MRRFLWYQVPFLAACLAIFGVSSLQSVPALPLPFLQDKIPHAVVFAVLAILAFRAFLHQDRVERLRDSPGTSAFLFSLFYGALDEFHQYYVPGRMTDIWDLVADVIGAAIGLIVFVRVRAYMKSRNLKGPAV